MSRSLRPHLLLGRSWFLLGLCVLGWNQSSGTARADLLAVDHFLDATYSNGAGIEGLNGGTGFAAWNAGHSNTVGYFYNSAGGLSYSGTSSSGGGVYANAGGTFNSDRIVSGASSLHTNRLYFGLLLQASTTPSNNSTLLQVRRLFSSDGVIQVGAKNGDFQFSAEQGVDSATVATGVAITANQTNLLIGRIDFNVGGSGNQGEEFRLYINPTSSTEPTTPNATIAATSNVSIDDSASYDLYVRLLADSAATLKVDELRFATSFSDFFSTTAVPEPATWLSMSLAGLGFLAYRRRWPSAGKASGR